MRMSESIIGMYRKKKKKLGKFRCNFISHRKLQGKIQSIYSF